ncbi:hypothetical protein [Streptosporangium sp. NPDC001681]|uniref:hypothetical protein n=1 Tax=Streptosporangium sp. NPDC001681 TaxID=3154395 RepID=UPI0033239842
MARTTTTATSKTKRKRRPVTEAQKARSAESRAAANELLNGYAHLLLIDPAELNVFLAMAASIGVRDVDDTDSTGYSLRNIMLLAAQRRPISHCGGVEYWNSLGRMVRKGEKSLATFRRIGGKSKEKTSEEKKLAAEGWQTVEKNKPGYYVKAGTFDVRQTRPTETCPSCGTTPADEDDRTTMCPSTCEMFALRPGPILAGADVISLAESLLEDAEDEADA